MFYESQKSYRILDNSRDNTQNTWDLTIQLIVVLTVLVLISDESHPQNNPFQFRLHGEAVVKAAVENGADQIDVAGEPEWIEQMEDKYGELARRNGWYVVSACGWDSVPADLGVALLKRHFDGDLSRIEAFVQLHFGPSVG